MKNLHVYKASAGSGKTTCLTESYLELMASGNDNFEHRHILAVTFTNKATEEMKSRIIQLLAKVANGEKELPYIDSKRAKEMLRSVLHDYSRFKISTIDRFFQQVIRAFVRELGINSNYGIELDHDQVIENAVDEIILSLDKAENKDVLDWLLSMAQEKIDVGLNWKIRDDLTQFGKEIFKEDYLKYGGLFTDTDTILNYKKEIKKISKIKSSVIINAANDLKNRIESEGLALTDFKGGSRSPLIVLEKFSAGEIAGLSATFLNLANDPNNFCTAKSSQAVRDASEWLCDEVSKFIAVYNDNIIEYNSAEAIYKFLPSLGVLHHIDKVVKAMQKEANSLLLSDSIKLLNTIVEDNDAPFVYEKVGTSIKHYLLDEFQDTSAMQWNNFKPLIAESLGNGQKNIVVGDVKQSIYRFRNSDWEILGNQLESVDFENQIESHTLSTNYRSDAQIVSFNNDFFQYAVNALQDKYNEQLHDNLSSIVSDDVLRKSYLDVLQTTKKDADSGYVEIRLLEGKNNIEDWRKSAIDNLFNSISELIEKKYNYGDITILVRRKKEAVQVAQSLLEKNIPVVSDEALQISSSLEVCLIVAVIKRSINQNDDLNKLYIEHLCEELNIVQPEEELSVDTPLYEFVEKLIDYYGLRSNKNAVIYMQAFQDLLLEYVSKQSSDANKFIEWWEQTGIGKSLTTGDAGSAVTIMTLHKSKGLSFNVVIMPFCTWKLDADTSGNKMNIMWCKTHAPFDDIPYVPVKYSKQLSQTIFAADYYKELMHNYMDNINLMYVAFTRPIKALICFCINPNKDSFDNVGDLLRKYINLPNLRESVSSDETLTKFTQGELKPKVDDVTKPLDESSEEIYVTHTDISRFGLRQNSERSEQTIMGTMLHGIMEKIIKSEDLNSVIQEMQRVGLISSYDAEKINNKLIPYINNPAVKTWFDGSYKILNERTIITENAENYRPDRIMISKDEIIVVDYKFGEKENSYMRQVSTYMSLLKSIGYKNVSGYLYYQNGLEVVAVS
ncbi:MAG: hypothetical protein EOL95_07850 [Bacteroidia bacterium]|nr:hypothetical protein [Bacteroidia bacterium]